MCAEVVASAAIRVRAVIGRTAVAATSARTTRARQTTAIAGPRVLPRSRGNVVAVVVAVVVAFVVALVTAVIDVAIVDIVELAARPASKRSQFFRLGTCLVASAARDVCRLALRRPSPSRDRTVVEADEIAELVELGLLELASVADTKVVKRQGRKRDALQLVDLIAERFEHPVNLAMLSLVDRDREPGVFALTGQHRDLGGHRGRAVVEPDALAKDREVLRRHLPVHLDVIRLRHVMGGREQTRGELAVVCQQQHALRIEIEPADRLHRDRQVRQIVHHGRTTTIVRDGRDACLRLVEYDVEAIEYDHRLAIEQDVVAFWIDLRAELANDDAVHRHAPCRDHLLGFATSRHAASGEKPLQSNRLTHDAQLSRDRSSGSGVEAT
jgi:hypothetical protein